MSWGYVIAAGATLVSGYMSNKGAKDAAKASNKGADAATEEQRRQFDITQENLRPWLDAGSGALTRQQAILDGDYTGFYDSPDYLAALDAGTKQLDAGAASRGNLWGGGTDADRIQFGQNLATQNLSNYWSKLAGMSGTGQQTATQLGGFGQNSANAIGENMQNAANTRASAYASQANNWGNVIGQLGNIWGQYQGGRANG